MTTLSTQAETGSADREAVAIALDEIDALRAENARLRECFTRLDDAIESSIRPKEAPHRMIFADGHIETGRAVDAYFRMMQKMQDAVRAALKQENPSD